MLNSHVYGGCDGEQCSDGSPVGHVGGGFFEIAVLVGLMQSPPSRASCFPRGVLFAVAMSIPICHISRDDGRSCVFVFL